ncbi:hypothetical protein LOC71_19145 [Rhodopirellula sp. JC740]|uniref:Uncharacterized protein n=1 Tax=Rhodopirellula halodulae TaxID=2894198 RepID=A0ABS8NLZ4_9BACT|nr:hypothetical protein [Rhodopirellula sp. JC740]MCC9644394.1 hypothetical protein [Rhodopirellula sp. JC740]
MSDYSHLHRTEPYEILERITALDEMLASPVSSISVDGTTTKFDIEAARKERQQLLSLLPGLKGYRPFFTSIRTTGG